MAKSSKARISSQVCSSFAGDFAKLSSSLDKVTPQNFDEFVPWMCLLWQSPDNVIITRIYQDDYVKAALSRRRQSTKSVKGLKSKVVSETLPCSVSCEESQLNAVKTEAFDDSIQMRAYYNLQGHLIELAIIKSPININSTIIRVIGLTIPFHEMFTKLTIIRGGLTADVIRELAKLLPQSYLTDICLDDTKVPQLNYPELLKQTCKLKNLSLKRCQLGDECCREIAACIETGTPGCTLKTLVLSSNMISDKGAIALADVLRRNRQLLHLDLSGNTITDQGGMAILNSLKEFPMRHDEIVNMKIKRLEYNQRKIAVYDDLVRETRAAKERAEHRSRASRSRSNKSMRSAVSSRSKSPSLKKGKRSPEPPPPSVEGFSPSTADYSYPELEQKAREQVGEFFDTFDTYHVLLRDRYFYCVGNMYLCSLNLAYNNLQYTTVKRIREVLQYQSDVKKPPGTTGLMRIIFDGNFVPDYCDEYVDIDTFLQKTVVTQLPKTPTPILKKKIPSSSRRSVTGLNTR